MRITKTSKEANKFVIAKEIANKGCDRCPCCGETKSWGKYMQEGITSKGILKGVINKTWVEGIFHMRNMKCDCYKCESCGAEWESEPYQWA